MPRCHRCERIQPSAEVRRTSLGHVCLDKPACARRVRANQPTIEGSKAA
jgi:hypothetical protein